MAQGKGSNSWGGLAIIAIGLGLLYYSQTGRGDENDSVLIPNDLEGRIDLVIEALNKRFGKRWVDAGLDAFTSYLRGTLPPQLVALSGVVTRVELSSRQRPMSGYAKRQAAMRMALGG